MELNYTHNAAPARPEVIRSLVQPRRVCRWSAQRDDSPRGSLTIDAIKVVPSAVPGVQISFNAPGHRSEASSIMVPAGASKEGNAPFRFIPWAMIRRSA